MKIIQKSKLKTSVQISQHNRGNTERKTGTVPMFKMHHVGTVPKFKTHHVGTLKNKIVLNVPRSYGEVAEPKRNTGA
jgi:hypothetical protein